MSYSELQMIHSMLGMLGKFSSDDILKYSSYFSLKTDFNISCKFSSVVAISMKC